jgi:hypothetical protein
MALPEMSCFYPRKIFSAAISVTPVLESSRKKQGNQMKGKITVMNEEQAAAKLETMFSEKMSYLTEVTL